MASKTGPADPTEALVNVGGLGSLKLKVEALDGNLPHTTDMFFERNKDGEVIITIRLTKSSGRQYHTSAIIPEQILLAALTTIGIET